MKPRTNPHVRSTSPGRIRSMALAMEPDEIAAHCGIQVEDVLHVLNADSRARAWFARCNKTGHTLQSHTERGAYLRAQIAGFADWRLYGEARV